MNNKERIEFLVNRTLEKCLSWIKKDHNGFVIFEDPNDKKEISAHYGATHAAAAFIIRGNSNKNEMLYLHGIELLKSILDRWAYSKKLPAYHFDFNNFALCAALPYIKEKDVSNRVRQIILTTEDSNNPTINWLPMRLYVNLCRKAWTGDEKYQQDAMRCMANIKIATNNDGGIEDRLPKGISFNLQYDVSTIGILQYINCRGYDINFSKELGFLLNAVAPDGDINYQGRGVNQIFAWSCWIYLLASIGKEDSLSLALSYVEKNILSMLANNNMMLNKWDGSEKYLWWDYHYASVYTAHFLFWMVLALEDFRMNPIKEELIVDNTTGLNVLRNKDFFIVVFEGRKEYLAEKGPVITALWTKKYGMITKGSFAPWQGAFGNNNIFEDIVLRNYFGLLKINQNFDFFKNKYIHKLMPSLETKASLRIMPLFCPIMIDFIDGGISITWTNKSSSQCILNLPSFTKAIRVEASVDNKPIQLNCVGSIRNQYDWMWIFQTQLFMGKKINIFIRG